MTGFTRRTHIVRIKGALAETYLDVEVMDAISFTIENGEEVVLNVAASDAVPYIDDDTGDGNAKHPGALRATRRSHMKRITGPDGFFDIEVLDAVAFRDKRGEEWVLDMPDGGNLNVYNTTTKSGSVSSTRRVHNEKIIDPNAKGATDAAYLTSVRCDTLAFRTANGDQVVLANPSNDDRTQPDPRANTFVHDTPASYDPTNPTGPAPPDNGDPSPYVFFPKGGGPYTGDTPIAMGPLWWIRGVSPKSGPWYWYHPVQQPVQFSLRTNPAKGNLQQGFFETYTWSLAPHLSVLQPGLFGIDRPEIPIPAVGFTSLDAAILTGQENRDWGLLDFSDTRVRDFPTPAIGGSRGSPDIWQVTGIPAPDLLPPTKPGGPPVAGPISAALAQLVATTYGEQWAATAEGYDLDMAALAVTEGTQPYCCPQVVISAGPPIIYSLTAIPVTLPIPTTAFAVPLGNPSDPTSFPHGGTFLGPIPGGYLLFVPNLSIFQPGNSQHLSVGQLDPAKWDTSTPDKPTLRPITA